jgi:hypothetical protein
MLNQLNTELSWISFELGGEKIQEKLINIFLVSRVNDLPQILLRGRCKINTENLIEIILIMIGHKILLLQEIMHFWLRRPGFKRKRAMIEMGFVDRVLMKKMIKQTFEIRFTLPLKVQRVWGQNSSLDSSWFGLRMMVSPQQIIQRLFLGYILQRRSQKKRAEICRLGCLEKNET